MLIALVGPASAGKLEVAKYLIVHHNFRPAFIDASNDQQSSLSAANKLRKLDRRWQELVPLCQEKETESAARIENQTFIFADRMALLDHATFHWRENIVTLDLTSRQDLECGFDKRPFFLLVGIDAPILVRWRRWKALQGQHAESLNFSSSSSLEDFVEADDAELYASSSSSASSKNLLQGDLPTATSGNSDTSLPATPVKHSPANALSKGRANGDTLNGPKAAAHPPPTTPSSLGTSAIHQVVVQPNGLLASRNPQPFSLRELMQACTLIVHNTFTTVSALHTHLASVQLSSAQRLRPSWDTYFLSLCTLASLRSNCMKRRVGAVLVRNNRVLSTGYNGTPRGLRNCADGGCTRCNGGAAGGTALDECLCLHAEENALLECGRERGGADGTVLYCNTCPCLRCAVKIVQTGVREVVYQLAYSMDDRSRQIFREANVAFRQYQPM